jgi:hypothetical protein
MKFAELERWDCVKRGNSYKILRDSSQFMKIATSANFLDPGEFDDQSKCELK